MIGQYAALAAGLGSVLAVALLFPLRGGAGEHAHAGPGTVTVDRLRASLTARATAPVVMAPTGPAVAPTGPAVAATGPAVAAMDAVPDEDIIWPSHDESEYAGKHRLRTDEWVCHRLATMLALHAHHERRPVLASGPPPRIDIRLHRAVA